jgi:hypothetical protein
MRTKRTALLRARRGVRITLTLDEWAILGAVARKYRKPLGWVFQVAAHAFLEPTARRMNTPRESRLETPIESSGLVLHLLAQG